MDNNSGVGVVDKVVAILNTLEHHPASLADLVEATGLARPTAHRIAKALMQHRILSKDAVGRFILGNRITELAGTIDNDHLLTASQPILRALQESTGESSQVFRRQGDHRICIAAAERPFGLRDTVPVGSLFPMSAGSAAHILAAWEKPEVISELICNATYTASTLATVRRRGWAQSSSEREAGVASVSAPVHNAHGQVIAALSISGPVERLTKNPGKQFSGAVAKAAADLSVLLRKDS